MMNVSKSGIDFVGGHIKRQFTLTFIVNPETEEILLGFKKRGFGKHFWNGFGGKPEPGESIIDAAKREVLEECGLQVSLNESDQIATIDYTFTNEPTVALVSNVFLVTSHPEGIIKESEEMLPKWFPLKDIPFTEMWPDFKLWFPLLLMKTKFTSKMLFNEKNELLNYCIAENEK